MHEDMNSRVTKKKREEGRTAAALTKIVAIFGEVDGARSEVNQTAHRVSGAVFRAVSLAHALGREDVAVVAMVAVGLGLPARRPR